ncbi:MAG: glycoside hydrolase family 76 protein, partial [Bacteroidales bacterium]
MKHFIVLSILFCFLQTTFSAGATSPYKEKMNEGVNTLVEWRDESGIWMKAGWWNSANILTAMLRYADVTNQKERFAPIIKDLFDKTKTQQEGNYINEYYDDEGWWLLAWIEAYKLTGERDY